MSESNSLDESASGRFEPPIVFEDGEDRPLFGRTPVTTSTTAEELSHEDHVNGWKLSRGMELVILCIVLIFFLAIVSVFPWAQKSEVIPMALDTLKLITTTVVGFVFGSNAYARRKEEKKSSK